jgi:S1-C subfamily serine protease
LALIGSVIAACGGGDDNGKKTAAPAPSSSAAPVNTQRAPLDTATILNQNKNTVVDIETTDANGAGGGTGIVWGDSSHVLTNAHVVVGGGSIKVTDPTDSSRSFPAKVIALSSCDDVALLQVDRAQNLQPAKIGDSDQVKPGDHVIALGFPGTLSSGPVTAIVTEGNVSRVHATFDFGGQRDLVQHTAAINPGNSGSPLFNVYGEVIGMNAYSARGSQSENYAISMNEAKTVADELKAGKNIDYLGVTLEPNDRDFAQQQGFAYIDGLVVLAVDPGSPADKATPYGLQYGDLIFDINGTNVESVGQFCDIVRSHKSGDTLNVRFGAYDSNDQPYSNFVYQVVVP